MKIYFENYGCTLNSGEAESMKRLAVAEGHSLCDSPDDAELAVLVTCTVIEPTELKMVRRMKELKKRTSRIAVTGCMASVQPELIRSTVPDAVFIPTPGQVDGFLNYLHKLGPKTHNDDQEKSKIYRSSVNDISVPVPIAEGCLGDCAYCITRLARGTLRSYGTEEILNNIRTSLADGAREFRLTAQDSATFGLDNQNGIKLPELLNRIGVIYAEGINNFKVRVGMMNPNSLMPILDDIIAVYQQPYIFKFLHLPVQSGSDRVLGAMNRNYDIEQFKSIIRRFREHIPGLTLSTDVIVGFPGETDDDHRETIRLLEAIKPNIVNITRYSERPNTPAEKMAGKLHGRLQKARSRELTELCRKISLEQNRKLLGSEMNVIATEKNIDRYKNTTLARSIEYKPVVIETGLELGKEYDTIIESVTEYYLIGTVN